MRLALRLAAKGAGSTRPNPPVGAVVVKNGRCVGTGWHRKAGGPHAEVFALGRAGRAARGATIYVTLEPCSTRGRTGPCTERILSAGVRRVVAAVRDPNPRHRGAGLRLLRRVGLRVTEGVCAVEGAELIRPFERWVRTGMPYVTLKMAMTLDGRIAEPGGNSRWVSGPGSRKAVHELRRRIDAVLVGRRTVSCDDPSLLPRSGRNRPLRVVVDTRGSIPPSSQILSDGRGGAVVATTAACPAAREKLLLRHGAAVWRLPKTRGGVSLKALMRRLGDEGCLHVLCEGGGGLARSLVDRGLVDEYVFFVAPKLLGPGSRPVIGGSGHWPLKSCPTLRFTGAELGSDDVTLRAFPERRGPLRRKENGMRLRGARAHARGRN